MFAQKIEGVVAQTKGSEIIITYSLTGNSQEDTFQVSLYCSVDGFSKPITEAKGDIGNEIKSGLNKQIHWVVNKELKKLSQGFSFEVKAKIFNPMIQINGIESGKAFKRSKEYLISWTSKKRVQKLNIELFNGIDKVWSQTGIDNTGSYNWIVPMPLKSGSDYKLKFSNYNDSTEFILSSNFTIRRKIPLVVKMGGLLVFGVTTLLVVQGTALKSDDLPQPPNSPILK